MHHHSHHLQHKPITTTNFSRPNRMASAVHGATRTSAVGDSYNNDGAVVVIANTHREQATISTTKSSTTPQKAENTSYSRNKQSLHAEEVKALHYCCSFLCI